MARMALANGDTVAMHLAVSATEYRLQPQPVRFGRVDDATGIDVLWDGGLFTTGIATGNSLDKILDPDVASQDLFGKVVRVTPSYTPPAKVPSPSPACDAVVLSVHKRQQNGSGDASADLALVQLVSNGAYLEVLASRLSRLDGSLGIF